MSRPRSAPISRARLSSDYIGNVFSEQQTYGFQTLGVIDVSYQQKLLNDHVELRLGRFAAMDDFLVSPYDFGFMQNALRKPVRDLAGCAWHERVLRHLGGAG